MNFASLAALSRSFASRALKRINPWLSTLAIAALWQVASTLDADSQFAGLAPTALASPEQVWQAAVRINEEGLLLPSLGVSAARVALGIAIALVIAVPAGLIAGGNQLGYALIDKPAHMLRAIPFNALAPLLIITLGIGESMKITMITIGVMGPLYVNLRDGARALDPRLLEVARVYHYPAHTVFTQILLKGTLSSLMTGLRFGVTVAWIALVVCESVNASQGIGYILARAQEFSRIDEMILCVVLYAGLGLLTEALVRLVERAALPWQATMPHAYLQ